MVQVARRRGLAAKTKGETEREEEREYPDSISRHLAEQAGRTEGCRFRRADYHALCRLRDNRRDKQYQDRGNDVREISQDDLADEQIYGRQAEHIKRCYQEDDDEEPLDEKAEKLARRELEARARKRALNAGRSKCLVDTERIDNLFNHATETDTDKPADYEDNDSDDYVGDERHQSVEKILERLAECIRP